MLKIKVLQKENFNESPDAELMQVSLKEFALRTSLFSTFTLTQSFEESIKGDSI